MATDKHVLAIGIKHRGAGTPWEVAAPQNRAGLFDAGDFGFTLACPLARCFAPRHVDAAVIRGAMIVTIDVCRSCGDVATDSTQGTAIAEAWRIVRAR